MTRKVMLTGATGYLGRAVLAELCGSGYTVRCLVRDPVRLDPPEGAAIEVARGDVLDRGSLVSAASGCEAILHLAGLAADWAPDAAAFERVNVEGTRHLLDAAREAGVRRVLATGTVMALGPTDGLLEADETTPRPSPAFFLPYQLAKARAMQLCRAARGPELSVAIVLPGALYGPGPLTDGNYLARVMSQLETGAFMAMPRDRGQRWCFAHVDDVARGHRLALERGDPDGEYVLGGDNVPFERMLEMMRSVLALPSLPLRVPGACMLAGLRLIQLQHAALGSRPPFTFGGGRALLRHWAFSSRKAKARLGYSWRPFEEAFPEFVRWYAALPRGARVAG